MDQSLKQCIIKFGPRPRNFSWWARNGYLKCRKPRWLQEEENEEDQMHVIFDHIPTLLKEGRVVWGHIVQANKMIFEEGYDNVGGDIVFSIEDGVRATPSQLGEVAHNLFSLKDTYPDDPELARVANYFTDELDRQYGAIVPSRLSPEIRCRISTVMFFRNQLPKNKLCKGLLPMIVNRQEPYVAMVLPMQFWPDDFEKWWTQDHDPNK